MNAASRGSGHDIIVGFQPIPPALEKIMRTVDRLPKESPAEAPEITEYTGRAARVLAEIRAALDDHEGFDAGQSALGVCEERNSVTGAHALTLRRLLRNGQYSAPLGETFTESGRLDPAGIENFDRFRYAADRFGLKLFIHQSDDGGRAVYRAFVVASENQSSTTFWFLARLLVIPFEVGQWSPIHADGPGG